MESGDPIYHYPNVVTAHPLYASCGSDLDSISEKDYPGEHYFPPVTDHGGIPALDMDAYETSLSGNNDCTVDAVIGICDESHGQPANGRHLLVELKIDCLSRRGPDSKQIIRKEAHSRDLLRGAAGNITADPRLAIVFHPDNSQTMSSWVRRKNLESASMAGWKAHTPSSLTEAINWGRVMPYTPTEYAVSLAAAVAAAAARGDIDLFEKRLKPARDYYDSCRLRHNQGECRYLSAAIRHAYDRLSDQLKDDGDDTQLILELLGEEIPPVSV